ncbi:snare-complex protein syntaxin-18 N-terminus-domain-containing protein [Zalerion maritima]|uniref:Snare-complex protein syntaxin-18 N-terminus-domain-containing protein n=1 Tax=Zalerion maritima TaxID=339359 RepID=A0AAD5WX65_9PEZI|nr:snare-complex protein syntaxin-18 N-terminus-domain-containing protein [Zalerion maritima]
MVNITPVFDDILAQHGGSKPTKQPTGLQLDTIDDFLEEAYKINSQITSLHSWLRNIRPSYLSSSQPSKLSARYKTRDGAARQQRQHLTNQDREQIDINAKAMLRELNARIENMNVAEGIRHDTRMAIIEKKHRGTLGALGAWAAGGGTRAMSEEHRAAEEAEKVVTMHRGNVMFYLRERLQQCIFTQTSMMEARITREKEKQKGILAKAGRGLALDATAALRSSTANSLAPGLAEAEDAGRAKTYRPEEELSSEQIQMFEKQNQDLLRQDEATLSQVRTAEQSLGEIAELQQELINNLTMQSEHINQLVEDSFQTTENVGGGNKQLQKASEKPSTARSLFLSTSAFCAFLVVWDLIF